MNDQKKTEAEEVLGGLKVAELAGAEEVVEAPVPPGFNEQGTGDVKPLRYECRLASVEAIRQDLNGGFPQIARLNRGKAIVRVEVLDPRLKDDSGNPERVCTVAMRYSISQDGRVTGPFGFFDESWSQFQAGANSTLARLEAAAAQDGDKGINYLNALKKSANVSTFANQGGQYRVMGGPIEHDCRAFLRFHAKYMLQRIASLPIPARQGN